MTCPLGLNIVIDSSINEIGGYVSKHQPSLVSKGQHECYWVPRNNALVERLLTIGGTLWILFSYTTVKSKTGEHGRWQILIMSYYRPTKFASLSIPPSNTAVIPAIYTEKK